ncbi:acyltransferase 3 [Xylariales sp. PMI_506]|nr:acyltransferase 3 [Xylariales sp. PMI_506]
MSSASRKFWALAPFCIAGPLGKSRRVLPPRTSTSYLDGLRGIACVIVFNQHVLHLLCQWSLSAYGTPGVAKHVLQLPVVRVVHAGDGMVTLFFVLSGYVLGYSPLRMIYSGAPADAFLAGLSSSVLRRGIRLFMPMFAFGFVTALVAWILPWYEPPESRKAWREDGDGYNMSAFLAHLGGFATDALSGIDPFDFSWEKGKPAGWIHCWTIPHEYRGSLAVYLACLATCKLTPAARKTTFLGLCLWFMCSPRQYWIASCFFAGLFLAEIRISSTLAALPLQPEKPGAKIFSIAIRNYAMLLSTILLGWPIWGSTTQQPYAFLRQIIIPKTWAMDGYHPGDEGRRYLQNIGSFMMLWAIEGLPWAQRVLSRPEFLYLGEICYSFFLLHWMVLYSFGRYLYSYLVYIDVYSHYGNVVVYACTLVVTIMVADLFWRAVDEKSIKFARWLVKGWVKSGQDSTKDSFKQEQIEALRYSRHEASVLPL